MSNEFKDLYNDLSEDQKQNYNLCMKYPILIPYHSLWGTVDKNYMYEYTKLDDMPNGWRIAFGEQFAADLQTAVDKLEPADKEKIYITDIKEKYGKLHTYLSRYSKELCAVINKYEDISLKTCIRCGQPATKMSTVWISPWCDECAKKVYDNFVDIEARS